MAAKPMPEEVGDLFVTDSSVTLKLLPSRKSGSHNIRWFSGGSVTNVKLAARDISCLVGRLKGRSRIVRGLTVATDRGGGVDLQKTGLPKAVAKAGFSIL